MRCVAPPVYGVPTWTRCRHAGIAIPEAAVELKGHLSRAGTLKARRTGTRGQVPSYRELSEPAVLATEPLVSVHMVTFNHEPFIEQALEGILMQETTFPIELVVGEDCSTDRTREIVLEYRRKHPDVVRVALWDKNVGGRRNSLELYRLIRGEYVAYNEGDDYWTDPHKLQKQVEILDAHPTFPACCHRVGYVNCETGKAGTLTTSPSHETVSIADIILALPVHASGFMFRRKLLLPLPQAYFDAPFGDVFVFCVLADRGDFGYIDEEMSIYRRHSGGIWSGTSAITNYRTSVAAWRMIDAYFGYRYHQLIRFRLSHHLHCLSGAYSRAGDRKSASAAEVASLRESLSNPLVRPRERVAHWLDLYTPSLIRYVRRVKAQAGTALEGKEP